MTQVVIKKEKPCILTEEFFEAGMYVFENDFYITAFDQDDEKLILVCLSNGSQVEFTDSLNKKFTVIDRGTVLEITV